MSEINKFIHNPLLLFGSLGHRGFFNWMKDERYLKIIFKIRTGQELNLNNPQTFNEKLQWLKLHDRRPEYSMMVDKYAVKKYVAEKIGEQYIIPTLGVWDRFDDIDFAKLPDQFVLKCTHDSGGLVICRDKSKFDIKTARKKINRCLKHNYFWGCREWPYKNVKPQIIAEKYMSDSSYSELTDYKLMCFNGTVKCIFTVTERFSKEGLKVTFFDCDWNRLSFSRHYPKSTLKIKPPINLKMMIKLAESLAKSIPFVRVDFYESGGKIYFGEMTFYPGSGFEEFSPEEWDKRLGDLIKLPNIRT